MKRSKNASHLLDAPGNPVTPRIVEWGKAEFHRSSSAWKDESSPRVRVLRRISVARRCSNDCFNSTGFLGLSSSSISSQSAFPSSSSPAYPTLSFVRLPEQRPRRHVLPHCLDYLPAKSQCLLDLLHVCHSKCWLSARFVAVVRLLVTTSHFDVFNNRIHQLNYEMSEAMNGLTSAL